MSGSPDDLSPLLYPSLMGFHPFNTIRKYQPNHCIPLHVLKIYLPSVLSLWADASLPRHIILAAVSARNNTVVLLTLLVI